VAGIPITEPEFWREVNLATVRGRPHSPAVGALVREAMRIRWFGKPALGSRPTEASSNADATAAARKSHRVAAL
jgi:LysR family transcriptional regulator, hydrogen peroxide-inducible genes activator